MFCRPGLGLRILYEISTEILRLFYRLFINYEIQPNLRGWLLEKTRVFPLGSFKPKLFTFLRWQNPLGEHRISSRKFVTLHGWGHSLRSNHQELLNKQKISNNWILRSGMQGNKFSAWDVLFTQLIQSTKKSKQLWFETAKGEYPCFFEQSAPLINPESSALLISY